MNEIDKLLFDMIGRNYGASKIETLFLGPNLEARKRVEVRNTGIQDEMTPLIYVCSLFDDSMGLPVVELLVSNGADVDAESGKRYTALHYAAKNNNVGEVEFLLRQGANPNVRNRDGQTPVFLAAHGPDTRVVSLLLQYGADIDIRDISGRLPEQNLPTFEPAYRDVIQAKRRDNERTLASLVARESGLSKDTGTLIGSFLGGRSKSKRKSRKSTNGARSRRHL